MSSNHHSAAGKLGAAKSNEAQRIKYTLRITEYLSNPTRCTHCTVALTYDKRRNIFCDQSCAASFNNRSEVSPKRQSLKPNCVVCDSKLTKQQAKFCSSECRVVNINLRIEQGAVSERTTLKGYLIRERGKACEKCKATKWLGEAIPLEVDHTNGDASNNFPSNIRLLCPNCHALEPTSKGKNRGNGRKSRGISRH